MQLTVVALLVGAIAFGVVANASVTLRPPPYECSPNETWKECVSSTCAEGTCEKPVPGPQCTFDCRDGCFCADGFYRNEHQECVHLADCRGRS
uniref:Putative serine proteinase inhibitor n=1 Tax=Amblyomma sculptum TaxID=1581419 RepID=A0A1E1XLG9_AMBSC